MGNRVTEIKFIIEELVNEMGEHIGSVEDVTSYITSLLYGHFKCSQNGTIRIDEFVDYLEQKLIKLKAQKTKKVA